MGPRVAATPFLQEEYPWKSSALISAFTQLLLSIFLLLNSAVICVTFHLLRLCGFISKNPSFYDSHANATRSPRKDASIYRKRSWSPNMSCTSCIGPNRRGMNHYLSGNKYERSFSSSESCSCFEWQDISAASNDHGSSSTRHSYVVEAGPSCDTFSSTCNKERSNVSRLPKDEPFLDRKASTSKRIDSNSKSRNSFREGKEAILDRSGSILEKTMSLSKKQDSFLEKKGSFLKRKGLILERSTSLCDRTCGAKGSWGRVEKAIASKPSGTSGNERIEDLKVFPREMDENKERQQNTKNVTKKLRAGWENSPTTCGTSGLVASQQEIERETGCLNDEDLSPTMKEKENGDELIRKLREALRIEREKLCDLTNELEYERIAAETAAHETLTKILHLQEEKAALRMQAKHYQRMAEEKATYDEQTMLIMKDILYRKERQNYFLEIEVDKIRKKLEREYERRMGLETPFIFSSSEDNPILLLKDVNEVQESKDGQGKKTSIQSFGDESDASSTASSSIIERICRKNENSTPSVSSREEHCSKRLKKRLKSADSVREEGFLVDEQNCVQFTLAENYGKKHITGACSHGSGCVADGYYKQFDEETRSIPVTTSGDDIGFNIVAIEEASRDSRGKEDELNSEGAFRLYGSILSEAVVIADEGKRFSMNSMDYATKEMFWMEFNQYKAGNESSYAQSNDEAQISNRREKPSKEIVRSNLQEQI